MTASIYADVLFLSTYVLILCWWVIAVSLVLVAKRRHRFPAYYSAILGRRRDKTPELMIHPQSYIQPLLPSNTHDVLSVVSHLMIEVPAEFRLPIQEGQREQIVIHIEPDGTPTNEQQNIQRLIRHLQTMPSKTTSKAAG